MTPTRLDELTRTIEDMKDSEIEYVLRGLPRFDYDRLRRITNWLTHRRHEGGEKV